MCRPLKKELKNWKELKGVGSCWMEESEKRRTSLEKNDGKQAILLNIEGRDFLVCELCVCVLPCRAGPRVCVSERNNNRRYDHSSGY
jgi:hypothetical protein